MIPGITSGLSQQPPAPPPVGDPLYAFVVSLLNLEGPNTSTTFTDETGKTWGASGGAALTTAQKPFGISSLDDPTPTAFINTVSDPAFAYGTGDFTIEFFARPTDLTGGHLWFDHRTAEPQVAIAIYHSLQTLRFYVNGVDQITSGNVLTVNTWHHVGLCRASGVSRLFVAGVQVGSDYADTNNYAAAPIRLGANFSTSNGMTGQFKGLRITTAARYTTTFTPPSALFPNF